MPRFYFDLRVGSTLTRDEDGADFPGIAAAEAAAQAAVAKVVGDRQLEGADEVSVEVRSELGEPVLIVTASAVMRLWSTGSPRKHAGT